MAISGLFMVGGPSVSYLRSEIGVRVLTVRLILTRLPVRATHFGDVES